MQHASGLRLHKRAFVPPFVTILLLGLALQLGPGVRMARAADDYRGAAVEGRGTVLGSTSYSPPAGAVFVSSTGSDGNSGTQSSPFRTVGRALDQAPTGGTVVLRAGNYHESVSIKRAVTVQNYPGEVAWLDGSSVVGGWTRSGAVWTAPWGKFYGAQPIPGGVRSNYPLANNPSMVFVDGAHLTQVGSVAAVTEGTFFADSANRRIVVGTDPSGKVVRSADLERAFEIGVGSVTLRGIGIRRYATTVGARAAVLMDPAGGTFENLVVSDNATIGMAVSGANKVLRNVVVERNGMMGIGSDRGDNFLLANSVVRYNNLERFPYIPQASGVKLTKASKPRIINNLITDSYLTTGLWLDGYNTDAVIAGNRILNNSETGINLEISTRGIIANNTVSGSRKGIELRDTEHTKIMNNHLTSYSLMGIFLAQDDRFDHRPSDAPPASELSLRNNANTIANNTFACGTRFQLFANDETARYSAATFNLTITGNAFSVSQKSPELNLMGWGLGSGRYDFILTPSDLAAKNSSWKNLQGPGCTADPRSTFSASALAATALPLPSDVAAAIGSTAGARFIGTVSGAAVPANQSPQAAISTAVNGLDVRFDGTQSRDADGSIASYAWTYGDGSTGSGSTSSHAYAKAGTYPVTLAVTDNLGARSTSSTSVTVGAAAEPAGATDSFSRSLTGSWGTSDSGQSWKLSGGASSFSVSNGKGAVALNPGDNREASLSSASSTSTTSTVAVSLDKLQTAGGTGVTVIGRRVGDAYYGGRVRFAPDGTVNVFVLRNETALTAGQQLASKYALGSTLMVKTRVSGQSPTTVSVKVWPQGSSEPTAWSGTTTDNTPALQSAGVTGIKNYLSGSGSGGSRVRLDDYRLEM